MIAYLFVFPAFVRLRYTHPGIDRPFRAPGGAVAAWIISLLSTGWALLATLSLLWPGIGTANPDAALPAGFEGDRLVFEAIVLSPLAMIVAVCATFLALGARAAARREAVELAR